MHSKGSARHTRWVGGGYHVFNHLTDTAIDNGYGTPRVVRPSAKPAPKTARQEGRQ